jgi:biotin operon repressor
MHLLNDEAHMQITITLPINIADLFDPEKPNHLPFLDKVTELYELIKDCQKRKGWAYFKLKFIAARLEISKRYAQKLIKVLRDHGLIEVVRRKHNYYRINPAIASNQGKKTTSNNPSPKRAPYRQEQQAKPVVTAVEPKFDDVAAAEILAAYEASRAEDLATQAIVEPMAEAKIQETVKEAAKSVRREKQYTRPRTITDYFNIVKTRLMTWGIDAPSQLLADVVKQYWLSWA